MKILVTGCAGFIGSHLVEYLLKYSQHEIIGLDNLDPYYSAEVKKQNLILLENPRFTFFEEDIRTTYIIQDEKPDVVFHLASLAGVRNSLERPTDYARVNIEAMIRLLEQSREVRVKQFLFASSSSVYGTNTKLPFSENDLINNINSPYAASKKAMEIYGQLYNQLYGINIIGFRFFTVYGPRGRPDMAPYKFMKAIIEDTVITKYGEGNSFRDYTYIEDIVQGLVKCFQANLSGFHIYNLGNGNPITLNDFIALCENVSGKSANIKQIENQLGDVPGTCADITLAKQDFGYSPNIKFKEGLTNLYEYLSDLLL
jgi:UDP-glucuronate 4-epimerase